MTTRGGGAVRAVVKVGGSQVDDAGWLRELAGAVSGLPGVVIVHGGGKEISRMQRLLGGEPEWDGGLRVTSAEALEAVAMVLSGLVNKRIVSALIDAGRPAAGVSGQDGAMIVAEPLLGGRLGRAGAPRDVDPALLAALLDAGFTPVVSPVSRGVDGGAMNVNADDAAAAVAAATGARSLLLVSDVPGVLAAGTILAEVAAGEVEALVDGGTASAGMAPKLRAAARAAAAGVEVRIGSLAMLHDDAAGTRVVASPACAPWKGGAA